MPINLNRVILILYQYCFIIFSVINLIALYYEFKYNSFLIGVNFVGFINCVFAAHYLRESINNGDMINIFMLNIGITSTLNCLFLIVLFMSFIFG